MTKRAPYAGRGPFLPSQLHAGDRYELSNGNAIYCAPVGGDGARRTGAAFEVIDTDPAVEDAGVDPGFTFGDATLRAPDVAVGVRDAPGWVPGVPPLAVEYASTGQDEGELQAKIGELLGAGTRWFWVVRLVGPRRVEVYEAGRPVVVHGFEASLEAPGVLKNPVPVRALFDREAAHEVALRNLLERRGYGSVEAIRAAGHAEGHAAALLALLAARGITPSAVEVARIQGCADIATLTAWVTRAATASSLAEVFAA